MVQVKIAVNLTIKKSSFEFVIEILLARIKCQCPFCEHDNKTAGFVEGKGFIDCVTESESNLNQGCSMDFSRIYHKINCSDGSSLYHRSTFQLVDIYN
jgi:hypothetical protein